MVYPLPILYKTARYLKLSKATREEAAKEKAFHLLEREILGSVGRHYVHRRSVSPASQNYVQLHRMYGFSGIPQPQIQYCLQFTIIGQHSPIIP
jgi:hypothetical protein